MANEYLKRQPTSSGNSRRWTVSFWMKNSDTTQGYTAIIGAGKVSPVNVYNEIFYNGSQIGLNLDNSTDPENYNITANPLLRDPSSWMHVIVSFTDQGDNANTRLKFYINGAFVDHNTGTVLDVSETSFFNHLDYIHYIGSRAQQSYGSITFDAQYFDVFLVDGQALTPDVFGFYKEGKGYVSAGSTQSTDFRPGQWVPKAPRTIKSEINRKGGFGVNGFYLPMNDSSNFGADFHTTPNSIITLKGEDLPQPRNGAPDTTDAYVSQLRTDPYAANLVLAVPGISTSTSANLVTNGTFDTNTSGWTSEASATLSSDNGRLKVLTTNTSYGSAIQVVTGLTIGQRYTFQVDMIYGNASLVSVIDQTAYGGSVNQLSGWQSADYVWRTSFVADATSLKIDFQMASQSGVYGFWDNVILKAEDAPRDYSADIKGSGTNKTLTAYGNAGVGYEIPSYYGSAMSFDGTGDATRAESNADFNLGDGDYTIEGWFYRDITDTNVGSHCLWAIGGVNSEGTLTLFYEQGGHLMLRGRSPGDGAYTNIIYVSPHNHPVQQWSHICTERHNSVTTVYLNGVAIETDLSDSTTVSQGYFAIGGFDSGGSYSFDGYIQDLRVYKGVAKYKGGFDVPKLYTPVGIESWRAVPDCTANNFATWNPLNQTGLTFASGNLTTSEPGSSGGRTYGTMGSNTGKWYYEAYIEDVGSPNTGGTLIGINPLTQPSSNVQNRTAYRSEGSMYNDSGTDSGSSAYAYVAGDTIGVAWDADNKRLWFAKNGTWLGSGDPAGNSNPNVNYTNTETQGPFIAYDNGTGAQVTHCNFGQNPTFSGNTTAGTFTDSNGKGLFKYQPPSGFLALCEDNLPAPAIADPGDYFKTVLWTGDGNTGRSITGVGFAPDFVWLKSRTSANNHQLLDSVRGWRNLSSNNTNTEGTNPAINGSSDGFSHLNGGSNNFNGSGNNYVAWCWKAGGAAVSNTDGSIASQVSVNQDAGFSIVNWTSNGATSVVTTGHRLAKTPKFMLLKNRDAVDNWFIYHESIQTNNRQYLQFTTSATITAPVDFWSTSSSTFGIRQSSIAANGAEVIAYCWTEIEGFSKFGSYVGNGNADGPFVYCGFKPAFILTKRTDTTSDWVLLDSSRNAVNVVNNTMYPNLTDPEYEYDRLDMLSNGFKFRSTSVTTNASGGSYIFAAFAESPFQTANAK